MSKKKQSGSILKKLLYILVAIILLFIGSAFWFIFLRPNVKLKENNFTFLYIPKNTSYPELIEIIKNNEILKDINSFEWYANKMKLNGSIIPGKYRITNGMNNRQIVKMLKTGKDEKVTLTINYTTRSLEQLAEKLCSRLNISNDQLNALLTNEELLSRKYNLNSATIACIIRPGKYELSWSTETEDFFDFMYSQYEKLWRKKKIQIMKPIQLSKPEIITLASIVDCESNIESEQKKIASVYLNRLAINMPLQADPTVIFALKNFSIQRLSFDDLKIDSPYNTYKYKGLPPGPVSFPSEQAIDAVLNHEYSSYLFFCAKPELNGYSNFSSTFEEHQKYADAYRKSLNEKGIRSN